MQRNGIEWNGMYRNVLAMYCNEMTSTVLQCNEMEWNACMNHIARNTNYIGCAQNLVHFVLEWRLSILIVVTERSWSDYLSTWGLEIRTCSF